MWHRGCQSYATGWLVRNFYSPSHNFSWLALTWDGFASSVAAKNKTLDKLLSTFWVRSWVQYCFYMWCLMWQEPMHQRPYSTSWEIYCPKMFRKNVCLLLTRLLCLLVQRSVLHDRKKKSVFLSHRINLRKDVIWILVVLGLFNSSEWSEHSSWVVILLLGPV